MRQVFGIILLMVLILCASCQKQAEDVVVKEPDRVTVQHILISFKGSIPKDSVTRTQEEAEKMTRKLAEEEGIFAGVSSGGAIASALKLSRDVDNAVIVTIICDRGDRYLSTNVFSRK